MSLKNTPLAGIKILDLSHFMAGPITGLLLADLGADVIKVERPTGDDARSMAPPWIGGESAAYLIVNRHKRGIAIDLKHEEGRQVFTRLAAGADIIIENYRHGVVDKLGIDYPSLRRLNERLIWCSISGYGRTGPYAQRPGFDLMAQAMSGLMSFTGEGPGRPPVKVGAPIADIGAGILGAVGILAALAQRERTGRGQYVESSLFEASIYYTFWQSAIALATGSSPGPLGSAHPLDAPYQAYKASDQWFVLGAANDRNWRRLAEAVGRPELATDPRFASNPARMANLNALTEMLQAIFAVHPFAHWSALLDEAGVPCAPILDVRQMHQDPQVIARKMIDEVEHTTLGRLKTLGMPIKLPESSADLGRGAPLLGEHTCEVLSQLGYSTDEIEGLIRRGAVVSSIT